MHNDSATSPGSRFPAENPNNTGFEMHNLIKMLLGDNSPVAFDPANPATKVWA